MTTHKLTRKQPNEMGIQNSCLGWHFTLSTALDALEGATIIQMYDWNWMIFPNPEEPTNQRMSVVKNGIQLIIDTPYWFTLDVDTGWVRVLDQDFVSDTYDVEVWTPPAH